MENVLKISIGFIVPIVEACGALVIVIEVLRTIGAYLISLLRQSDSRNMETFRTRLGKSMVMGLEFQVAADILKTTLSPQWNDILLLAALIGLRTLLNYLLEFELERLDRGRTLSTGYNSESGETT
jgi:uncharacterized membrane protein